MKYCRKCGQEIADEAFVCISCGCLANSEWNNAEPHQKSPVLVILIIFIAIVGIILACVITFVILFFVQLMLISSF